MHKLLQEPTQPIHHRRTGCNGRSQICYPSLGFLEDLMPPSIEDGPGAAEGLATPPSPFVVVELGAYLGESTVGFAQTFENVKLERAVLVSMDTWHEQMGFTGVFQHLWGGIRPTRFYVPSLRTTEPLPSGHSLLYEQWVRNINSTGHWLRRHVVPFPLLAKEASTRAEALGSVFERPQLVYINPARNLERMRHQLHQAWRCLRCGGSLAGSGYHLVRDAVDEFAARGTGDGRASRCSQPTLSTRQLPCMRTGVSELRRAHGRECEVQLLHLGLPWETMAMTRT